MDEREFDVINVIPFIDIMLVLLTIVLTTSTFIAQGTIPVDLPRASRDQAEALRTQTIDIDRRGTVFLNARQVELPEMCVVLQEVRRETPILIRADRALALQLFVDVMDAVKNLGFKRVSLQTERKT